MWLLKYATLFILTIFILTAVGTLVWWELQDRPNSWRTCAKRSAKGFDVIGRTTVSRLADLLARAKRKTARATAKRVLPRISNAGRGLVTGVNLSEFATLQERDDLDYLGRLQRQNDFNAAAMSGSSAAAENDPPAKDLHKSKAR